MARPRKSRPAGPNPCLVVIYLRVSTEEQATSGLGLEAQRAAIEAWAQRRGCIVAGAFSDPGVSAKSMRNRPGLASAIDAARACGGTLLVQKLDRLTRSTADLYLLMARSAKEGWALASTDGTLDTSTPMGRAIAGVAGVFAQLERELASERTVAALAVKKAQGARLGRPVALPADVRGRIVTERQAGATMAAIATGLTADAVPTAQGGARWYPSTVQSVLRSVELDAPAA